jgi:TPP-dependent 2-oxoacid decarboxylase
MSKINTISDYLIQQLSSHGVRHVFGVPGDFALKFYNELDQSELQIVNTADAQGAGYAADAYARVSGLGVVCVTYGVGGFCITNTTAQAFAEKSPVVVISGVPSAEERAKNQMYHHRVGEDSDTQLKVFKELTVASTRLDNPETAAMEIDRVLKAAVFHKQPVYIELPSDMVTAPYIPSKLTSEKHRSSNPDALQEAVREAEHMINAAGQPVIIAGVELHRFGLQNNLHQLLNKANIPFATMLLGKSVVSEQHPLYIGLYIGAFSKEDVREYVESSDCLIMLGAFQCELNLGAWTARLDMEKAIDAGIDKTSIRSHTYKDVYLPDFLTSILKADISRRTPAHIPHPESPVTFKPADRPITVGRLLERLNTFLDDNTVVVADPGNSLFVGADLMIRGQNQFLAPAYYLSLGYAVPASIGVQLAMPHLRPLVLVGDGAFLMTGIECATAARFKLNPIIIVFNNRGYSSERRIIDGSYNDIPLLKYSSIPEICGSGKGFDINTETDLDTALEIVMNYKESFCILDVHLDQQDIAPILQRVASMLSKRRKGSGDRS